MDFTSLKDKAMQLLGKHPDKVNQAIDKVSEIAKGKVAGHDEQIDKLAQQAKDHTPGTEAPPPQPPTDPTPGN
ncbi:antitoxin [Pseudonocardia sp. Cha107L01]|uniref:antitoxin n=1 Tax=Pseudonocardia sp. Cha107L01 TaxID=3457576 RepID=UPI00403E6630